MLLIVLLLAATIVQAGGGKAAYKNYVEGSFYFSEGQYGRALNHLRRARQLAPDVYVFNLALALALGKTGEYEEGQQILLHSDNLLKHDRPDYRELLALRHYIGGLIHAFGRQYYRAIPAYKMAIDVQLQLDNPQRLAGMYNALGYAEMLDQGRGRASGHNGLAAHYHIHRRDMERGFAWFEKALEYDPTHRAAGQNYQLLCDSLGREPAVEVRADTTEEIVRYVSAKYSNLPARMDAVLEFGHYDEVVYLLDISGSMTQEKVPCVRADRFTVMKETAQFLLDDLPAETRIGIGTIGGDCGTVPKLWHPAGTISHYDMRWALRFLVPDGTTPLLTILQETPTLFSEVDSTRKALFFISDGENICNVPGVDICEWTSELSRRNIEVNVLTFLNSSLGNTNAFAEYTCLTDRTGGRILYLDGNRCSLERYEFDMVDNFQQFLPELTRVDCWGPAVENLWAIFPE